MHPVGLLLHHAELFVLHVALAVVAIFEVALALVNLPECFVGQYEDPPHSGACSLGVAVGSISLVVGLVLWAAGVLFIIPPRYYLPLSFFTWSSFIACVVCLLWLMSSLIVTMYFGKVCNSHRADCTALDGYGVAMWMVIACWVITVIWCLLFVHSVWRRHQAHKEIETKGQTSMELATFRSKQEAHQEFEPMDRRGIIRSGYLQMRKVPLESSKPAQLWVKRYVVLTEGKITTFTNSDTMTTSKGDEVVLSVGARVVEQTNGPHTTEGTWSLEVPGRKERIDFIILEEPEMEQPNLSPDPQEGSLRDEDVFERRFAWLRAFAVSLPSCVFGVPIGLAVARNKRGLGIPEPIAVSLAWLDTHALDEQGLYRVPGSKQDVDSMITMFNRGQTVTIPEQFFGGNVASVVVQFLKRLPSPLFTVQLVPLFERAAEEGNVKMLRLLVSKLPKPHFCTLRAIIQHLARVAEFSALNEMSSSNLAICVFSSMAATADVLIVNCEFIFNQPEPTVECECVDTHFTTCALCPFRSPSRLDRALSGSRLSDHLSGHLSSGALSSRSGERVSAQGRHSFREKAALRPERREDGGQRIEMMTTLPIRRSEEREPVKRFNRPYERPVGREEREDDLRQQLADIERSNYQLQFALEEQRRVQERESARRARQAVERERAELQIRDLLQQMVTTDQQQQVQHDARIARLEAELAQLRRSGRI